MGIDDADLVGGTGSLQDEGVGHSGALADVVVAVEEIPLSRRTGVDDLQLASGGIPAHPGTLQDGGLLFQALETAVVAAGPHHEEPVTAHRDCVGALAFHSPSAVLKNIMEYIPQEARLRESPTLRNRVVTEIANLDLPQVIAILHFQVLSQTMPSHENIEVR